MPHRPTALQYKLDHPTNFCRSNARSKPVDHAVCVAVSDLPLPLRQRVRSQEIPLEEYSVGDGEDTITVQVTGSAAAT